MDYGESERVYEAIRFLGCNWAVPAAALRSIGGFNRHFGPGAARPTGQETLAQRMLGLKVLRKLNFAPYWIASWQ